MVNSLIDYKSNNQADAFSLSVQLFADNTVQVLINSKPLSALADTGAVISIIAADTISQFIPTFQNKLSKSKYDEIVSASGHCVPILGTFPLRFSIGTKQFRFPLHVTAALGKKQMILGCDFLKSFNSIIDFRNSSISFDESALVWSSRHYTLKPKEVTLIQGKIKSKHQYPTGLVGHLMPRNAQMNVEIHPAAVSITSCTLPIKIYNPSDVEVTVNKGQKLGKFTPWNSTTSAFKLQTTDGTNTLEPQTPHANIHKIPKYTNKTNASVHLLQSNCPQIQTEEHSCYGPNIHEDYVFDIQDALLDTSDVTFNFEDCKCSPEELERLKDVLTTHQKAFIDESGQLGETDLIEQKITLKPGTEPFWIPQYRVSPAVKEDIDKSISKLLKQGVIEYSSSIFNSPIIILEKGVKKQHKHMKKDANQKKSFRFLSDLRFLNSKVVRQALPIMRIDDILDTIGERTTKKGRPLKYLTTLDMCSGYYQIVLEKGSREYTAFSFNGKHLQYCRMPQGFRNSAGIFCQLMNKILGKFTGPDGYVSIYLDDILITSCSFEEHMEHIETVLQTFIEHNLKLSPKKTHLLRESIDFLGYKLSTNGLKVSDKHVAVIKEWPKPSSVKELRGWLGVCNYNRRFIKNIGDLTAPLNHLTRKHVPFVWSKHCQESFDKMKSILCSDILLRHPRYDRKFTITTDGATKNGIGGLISQECPITKELKPVAFTGRALKKNEKNWSTVQIELLAVVYCIEFFRPYILGTEFNLVTDCMCLKSLLNTKALAPRLARYSLILQGYDFTITHRPGSSNLAADGISRRPFHSDPQGRGEVENQESGIGYPGDKQEQGEPVLNSNTNKTDCIECEPIQVAAITRAQSKAEKAPQSPKQMKDIAKYASKSHHANIHPDALTGMPKVSKKKQKKSRHKSKLFKRKGDHIDKQELEKTANEVLDDPRFCFKPESVRFHQHQDRFCKQLILFLEKDMLPSNKEDARRVLLREYDYVMYKGVLWHVWTPIPSYQNDHFLRLVIPKSLVETVLEIGHTATFAGHCGINKMTSSLKPLFSWPGICADVRRYVSNCHTCLVNKRSQNLENPLLTLFDTVHAPFEALTMDLCGPFLASGPQKYLYFAIVCCRYSRYIITFPLKSRSAEEFATQFYKHVILTFGPSESVHSDCEAAFKSQVMTALCKLYGIKQSFTSAFHPQSNGLSERGLKTIVNLMRNFVNEKGSDWASFLKCCEYAINTTQCSVTGHSPFLLVFGRQAKNVIMTEFQRADDNMATVSEHFSNILETQRVAYKIASEKNAINTAYMKKHYDKFRHESKIVEGSIVYLNTPRLTGEHVKPKWAPFNYGPYVVLNRHCGNDTCTLKDLTTNRVREKTVHISRLKLASGFIPEQHYAR